MEDALSALVALIIWRILVCAVGSMALAFAMSHAIPSFTAEYGIALVILGTVCGLYWQSRTEVKLTAPESVEDSEISKPVAFLGLAFVGLIVGGTFAELFSSKLWGAVTLAVGATAVAAWYHYAKHRPVSREAFAFAMASLQAGFWVVLLLSLWGAP